MSVTEGKRSSLMNPYSSKSARIALAGVIVVGGLWVATQWAAVALAPLIPLGRPWMQVLGASVYPPWQLFAWWFAYEARAPQVFATAGLIAIGGGLFAALVSTVVSLADGRSTRLTTHGSARWADPQDAAAAGLFAACGVMLGRFHNRYLCHGGPQHVLVEAPTRSGKGVGIVVPTLLVWPHSVVVHDIKGENWALTAGWRSRFSHCLYFDSTDPHSAAYNPLLDVRRGEKEVRDAQNIADMLVDPEGAQQRRSHWELTAHALLVGVILHVLYAEEDKSLRGVADFLADPSRPFEAALWSMMTVRHLGDRPHPVVAAAGRELLNKAENERSGVLSTAVSFLSLYRDPVVAQVTSRCDWRIADLMDAEHPVSLYLAVPPSDLSRTRPLMRLLLNQIGRRLTEAREEGRRPLLWALDEFPALGRLDFFESALAHMAGYGMRALLVVQSLHQLERAYGPHHALLDNCHVRVRFAPNDERSAARISEALGTTTLVREQRSYGGSRGALWLDHINVSQQISARPLLTPSEVMQLPSDEELVMVAGHPPLRAKKLRYYADQQLMARVSPAPTLQPGGYVDRPTSRPDDWADRVIPRPELPVAAPVAGVAREARGPTGRLPL